MHKQYSKKYFPYKLLKRTISNYERVATSDPILYKRWKEIHTIDRKFSPMIDYKGDMSDNDIKNMINLFHRLYIEALKDVRNQPKKRSRLLEKLKMVF